MPFTPFHLGVGLCVGLVCYRWLDFATVLAASVAVDVRAAFVLFGVLDGPVHGPLHTVAGSTLLAAGLGACVYAAKPALNRALAPLSLAQERSGRRIAAAALAGAYAHVGLDATLYADVRPLAPLVGDPLLGVFSTGEAYLLCTAGFLLGLALYVLGFVGDATAIGPAFRA